MLQGGSTLQASKLDSAAKKSITDQPCVAVILFDRRLHLHITEEMKHKTAQTRCVGCLQQKINNASTTEVI